MTPRASHRILQVHPTRRCNLRCLHCYSASGPEERGELPLPLLQDALSDAAREGYTVVSLSGGEPLLYSDLAPLLDHAHACGLRNTLTTNGMLLDERCLESLKGRVDLMAISLDGLPSSHDRLRASPRAFATMARRLDGVRRSGVRFGFVFTLTQTNLHELGWVAEFALEQGAALLQIHPLEEMGRAREALPGERPDEWETNVAFLEYLRLFERVGKRMPVQLDLAHREVLRGAPERAHADALPEDWRELKLAELVSPLIIEADGTVAPIQHGFPRRFTLGNLHAQPLQSLARHWREDGYLAFHEHCLRAFTRATSNPEDLPAFNWYELVTQAA
jgi:MoaA/NifB/PqqE/SkfB family radical SAM enzyme